MAPSSKVAAATAAAGVVTILCWILSLFGILVPDYVQGAVTTVLVFAAGWLVPEGSGKRIATKSDE